MPRRRLAEETREDRPSAEVVMFQRPPDDPGVEEPSDKDAGRARLY
jgi:hypothetical protein